MLGFLVCRLDGDLLGVEEGQVLLAGVVASYLFACGLRNQARLDWNASQSWVDRRTRCWVASS